MANEKYSTPDVVTREVDNTVRANAAPGDGRGAIVLNANKGYVNQRVVSTSLGDFYKMYGTPDNPNQYGHFAAAQFFGHGSRQLMAVRATMGDEGYAQVQYPYTDASTTDTNVETTIQQFGFIDNTLSNNVKLINLINSASWEALSANGYDISKTQPGEEQHFGLVASSDRAILKNVTDEFNGDDSYSMYVYRDDSEGGKASCTESVPGRYFRFINQSGRNAKTVEFTLKNEVYEGGNFSAYALHDDPNVVDSTKNTWTDFGWYNVTSAENAKYWNMDLYIPSNSAVNGVGGWMATNVKINSAVFDVEGSLVSGSIAVADLIKSDNLQIHDTPEYEELMSKDVPEVSHPYLKDFEEKDGQSVSYIKVTDWDDNEIKSFTVRTDEKNSCDELNLYPQTHTDVEGLEYKEYGLAEYANELIIAGSVEAKKCIDYKGDDYKKLVSIAEEYGIDATDVATEEYGVISYKPAKTWLSDADTITKIVKLDDDHTIDSDGYTGVTTSTFVAYQEYGSTKVTQKSTYKADDSEFVIKPWQTTDGDTVSKLIAMSTTEIVADSSGQWADGYTPSCDTDDDPGNGDIETFESNQQNQLVIAALAPGEWGNDIGVAVITAEAAKYPCLYNQNAFSWKYQYDDEDKVDNAEYPNDYTHNEENLTWKKVYKINVYAKPKDKTAKYWGFGLDALTADPIESWRVSNDPNAKDANGNSLYAPYVINGRSNYIYVSKKSVAAATNYKGEISQPKMTWSIYQLLGGSNSSLNNVKEKTAALTLYESREKADFDILFNVEAIDSFNGKQRFAALQRRIGEIAADRGKDIGVIQVTSREAKTVKQELSEGKSFAFTNGSYVAAYAGYDRYFDSYTSSYVYLPKSVAGACAMCTCDTSSYPWMAPAGTTRGIIDYSERPNIRHTKNEIGQLYDNQINTSITYASSGEVLLGQKTMLKKNSALNRIDVRRLVNYIEKNLETMLFPFLFEKNTVNTRTAMKTTVDAFLSRIMSAQGILSKRVTIATDPDDSHIVYVNLSIVPAESIEWICVTVTLDRQSGTTSAAE